MTGFEYALGGLMLAEGRRAEGAAIVSAVRDRYDGVRRNPWNEIECGSNYVRSMAAFALIPIYAGMQFDARRAYLGFSPIKAGDGCYFFSSAEGYGTVEYRGNTVTLTLLGGRLSLAAFSVGRKVTALTVDGRAVDFSDENGCAAFEKTSITRELIATVE